MPPKSGAFLPSKWRSAPTAEAPGHLGGTGPSPPPNRYAIPPDRAAARSSAACYLASVSDDRKRIFEDDGELATDERKRTKKPRQYKVVLHNDNYTPRQFVVLLLEEVFRLSRPQASAIMMAVHNSDRGVIGTWPHEIAEAKSNKANTIARDYGDPLMTTTEPE